MIYSRRNSPPWILIIFACVATLYVYRSARSCSCKVVGSNRSSRRSRGRNVKIFQWKRFSIHACTSQWRRENAIFFFFRVSNIKVLCAVRSINRFYVKRLSRKRFVTIHIYSSDQRSEQYIFAASQTHRVHGDRRQTLYILSVRERAFDVSWSSDQNPNCNKQTFGKKNKTKPCNVSAVRIDLTTSGHNGIDNIWNVLSAHKFIMIVFKIYTIVNNVINERFTILLHSQYCHHWWYIFFFKKTQIIAAKSRTLNC